MSNVYTSDITVDNANKDQLVESIRLREQRLAANVDEFVGRVHPKALLGRVAKSTKNLVIKNNGEPKVETIVLASGVALGVAALITGMVIRKK